MLKSTLISSLTIVSGVWAQRTLVVYNGCPFTVWPAMFTGTGTLPSYPTGWQAAAYTSVTFQVPSNWTSGRIWGRQDCDFSTNPGPNSCVDGGCNGGLQCNTTGGTGVPPVSLAEFTLGSGGVDYYDVSLVDGFNLPLAITNTASCSVADCPVDLSLGCPTPLIGPFNSTGSPVGCKSACDANLDGNPTNSPNCCTGQYNTAATCPSSGVQYYSYFKNNCPNSYCYAYDDATGLKTCPSNLAAVYTVTFCPSV